MRLIWQKRGFECIAIDIDKGTVSVCVSSRTMAWMHHHLYSVSPVLPHRKQAERFDRPRVFSLIVASSFSDQP